jgi:hypothetical protein
MLGDESLRQKQKLSMDACLRAHLLRRLASVIAAMMATLAGLVEARAESWHAIYSVSLIGLPIGTADVSGQISSNAYRIEASAKIVGLATVLSTAKGAATGSGAIASGHVLPATFATTAANAKMTRTVRMAVSDGVVTGVDISPPIEEKPGRVPLRDQDKHGIVDPVGSIIVPVAENQPLVGPAACNRSIPIFDGYTRFDLRLSYVGQRRVAAKGYSGPVVVCAARYVPIAGHNPDRPAVKFMINNKQMEVWLAPIESAHVLVPFRASLGTMIGTTVVEASEFTVGEK